MTDREKIDELNNRISELIEQSEKSRKQNDELKNKLTGKINKRGSRTVSMLKDKLFKLRNLNSNKSIFARISERIDRRFKEATVTSASANEPVEYDYDKIDREANKVIDENLSPLDRTVIGSKIDSDDQLKELTDIVLSDIKNLDEFNFNKLTRTSENSNPKKVMGTMEYPYFAFDKNGNIKFKGTSLNDLQKMGLITKGLAGMLLSFPVIKLATGYVALSLMKANSLFWNNCDSMALKNFYHSSSEAINNFLGKPFQFDNATGKWYSQSDDFVNQTKNFFHKLHIMTGLPGATIMAGTGIYGAIKGLKTVIKGRKKAEAANQETSTVSDNEKPWNVQNNLQLQPAKTNLQLQPAKTNLQLRPASEDNISSLEPTEITEPTKENEVIYLGPVQSSELQPEVIDNNLNQSEIMDIDDYHMVEDHNQTNNNQTNNNQPIGDVETQLIYPDYRTPNIKPMPIEQQEVLQNNISQSINGSLDGVERNTYQQIDAELYAKEKRINEIEQKNYKTDQERDEMSRLITDFNNLDNTKKNQVSSDQLYYLYDKIAKLEAKEVKTPEDIQRLNSLVQTANSIDDFKYSYQENGGGKSR